MKLSSAATLLVLCTSAALLQAQNQQQQKRQHHSTGLQVEASGNAAGFRLVESLRAGRLMSHSVGNYLKGVFGVGEASANSSAQLVASLSSAEMEMLSAELELTLRLLRAAGQSSDELVSSARDTIRRYQAEEEEEQRKKSKTSSGSSAREQRVRLLEQLNLIVGAIGTLNTRSCAQFEQSDRLERLASYLEGAGSGSSGHSAAEEKQAQPSDSSEGQKHSSASASGGQREGEQEQKQKQKSHSASGDGQGPAHSGKGAHREELGSGGNQSEKSSNNSGGREAEKEREEGKPDGESSPGARSQVGGQSSAGARFSRQSNSRLSLGEGARKPELSSANNHTTSSSFSLNGEADDEEHQVDSEANKYGDEKGDDDDDDGDDDNDNDDNEEEEEENGDEDQGESKLGGDKSPPRGHSQAGDHHSSHGTDSTGNSGGPSNSRLWFGKGSHRQQLSSANNQKTAPSSSSSSHNGEEDDKDSQSRSGATSSGHNGEHQFSLSKQEGHNKANKSTGSSKCHSDGAGESAASFSFAAGTKSASE